MTFQIGRRLLLISCVTAAGCQGPEVVHRGGYIARCQVERQECAVFDVNTNQCLTISEDHKVFVGDVCYDPSVANSAATTCQNTFCTNDINAPGFCNTTVFSAGAAPEGVCGVSPAVLGPSEVIATLHSERCGPDVSEIVGDRTQFICDFTTHDDRTPPPDQTLFLDTSMMTVLQQLGPPSTDISRATDITFIDGASFPPPTAALFQLTPGPVASASGGGVTAGVTARRGLATIGQVCTPEICVLKTLDSLRVDVADTTVAGVPLTNLLIATTAPAPLTSIGDPSGGTFLGVAAGQMTLRVSGKMNGVDTVFFALNDSPWRVDAATPAFHLQGGLTLPHVAPNGGSVTVTADAHGTPATAQTTACAAETGLQRLFGFEDVQRWSSTQAALSLATAPLTQGCGALGVQGSGYMTIAGGPFSTSGLATNAAASVDLFIPGNQPNPSWLGALQMYLSCPSGNVFNQYIGQVELTGKPQSHYSTLRFPLPSAVQSTLARPLDDCAFSFALNVNATGQTWLLDNLRFTP
jgi:hypothetical protein